MKEKPPKGIKLLSIVLVLGALFGVSILFRPNSNMIYLGQNFGGNLFKFYYLVISLLHIIAAIGIYKLRRWSLKFYAILTVYFVAISVINIVFTESDTLIEIGWKLTESTMTAFYTLQMIVIIISVVTFLWLYSYRHKLN